MNLRAILSVGDLSLHPLHLTRGYHCMVSTVEKIGAVIATRDIRSLRLPYLNASGEIHALISITAPPT